MKNYKLDIFKVLNKISHNDYDFVDHLSEDELKSISPYVLQMWIKGADNNLDARMVLTNEVVNPYVFSLGDHKKLLYKLLCVSNGFGIDTRYYFKKKSKPQLNKTSALISKYYECTIKEALDCVNVNLLDKNDIKFITQELGLDSKETKEIEKEYENFKKQKDK